MSMLRKKIEEIEKKIPNHDQYITINDFSKFSGTIFDERLKEAKLATKTDIAVITTKTYFDEKLKNTNKKVASNKTFRGWKEIN